MKLKILVILSIFAISAYSAEIPKESLSDRAYVQRRQSEMPPLSELISALVAKENGNPAPLNLFVQKYNSAMSKYPDRVK